MINLTALDFMNNCYYRDNTQYFLEIAQLIQKNNVKYGSMLQATGRKNQPQIISRPRQLYAWMLNVLPSNAKNLKIAEQCYWLLNGLKDFPKCKICGKSLSSKQFLNLTAGYRKCCSKQCKFKDPEFRQHISNAQTKALSLDPLFHKKKALKSNDTRQKKYGAYCPQSSYDKRRKTRQQNMQNDPNYLKNINEKTRQTKIRNGHAPNWNNGEQMRKTRLERNNGKWESELSLQHRKQHAIEKYGVDDANKSDIVTTMLS